MTWEEKRRSCFDYLDQHKEKLTPFQYKSIKRTIGSLALENMFVSSSKIDRLIDIALGKISAEDSIAQLKDKQKI